MLKWKWMSSPRIYRDAALGQSSWAKERRSLTPKIGTSEPKSTAGPEADARVLLNGFLVSATDRAHVVTVAAHVVAQCDLGNEVLGNLKSPYFVAFPGTPEEFHKLTDTYGDVDVELPSPRLSHGQLKWLLLCFLLISSASAWTIRLHSPDGKALEDFLAYFFPCAAAVVVAANLYLGRKLDELVTYEASVALLFLGMMFNAMIHPCGSAVVTLMALGGAAAMLSVLIRRFALARATTKDLLPALIARCLVVAIVAATMLTVVYWSGFFDSVNGHAMCPIEHQ
jgi:hypothetical protein